MALEFANLSSNSLSIDKIKCLPNRNAFFMLITPEIKRIIQSISGRSNKYWEFWLSRHEYEKYWLTEMKLRTIINNLVKEGYITKIRCEYFSFLPNMIRRRNIYKATQILIDLVKSFTKKIVDLNEKIVRWCSEQNPLEVLRQHGIEVFGKRVGKKNSSTTVSIKWEISDWKTGKKWNLFNYLKDHEGQGTVEFYKNFIW